MKDKISVVRNGRSASGTVIKNIHGSVIFDRGVTSSGTSEKIKGTIVCDIGVPSCGAGVIEPHGPAIIRDRRVSGRSCSEVQTIL